MPAWAAAARAELAQADAPPGPALRCRRTRRQAGRAARTRGRCPGARPGSVASRKDAPLALFAVGGYGRGELFPQSDIDLLVLAEPDGAQARQGRAGAFRRPALGRRPAGQPGGALRRAMHRGRGRPDRADRADRSAPAGRPRRGNRGVARDDRAGPRLAAARLLLAKREEQRQRHARFGDTSDNLEPNLKDGPGGLRDLHMLGWLAQRSFGVRELEPLVGLGHLGPDEAIALERERRVLCRLRYGLHLVAGRREERLRFDTRSRWPRAWATPTTRTRSRVEKMMQGFYRSAAIVRRIDDRLLQRFEEHFDGGARTGTDRRRLRAPARLPGHARPWLVAARIPPMCSRCSPPGPPTPALRGLHSQTARELAQMRCRRSRPTPMRRPRARRLHGPAARPAAGENAGAHGAPGRAGRWIPAFARVSGRMQFDLFHVYTVDQHTLAVLHNLAASPAAGRRALLASRIDVWPSLRKPELLLLAGCSTTSPRAAAAIIPNSARWTRARSARRTACRTADTALVEWLVRKHLVMSVTAQKQDITDPEVIHRFAGRSQRPPAAGLPCTC
jgi:[protein-PII] uridylyltransferase